MRVGVITQARMTSSRLPGKVLLPLGGISALDRHLDRLEASELSVVLAITKNQTDDPLEDIGRRRGLAVTRGSEDDVLSRFQVAAAAHELDVVVRVTSDCPLIDGRLIKAGVDQWLDLSDPNAYLSNTIVRRHPRGMDFEVFSRDSLERANSEARSQIEREHVTPFLYRDAERSKVPFVDPTQLPDGSDLRLTLDTAADYLLLDRLFSAFPVAEAGVGELINLIRQSPELTKINAHVQQKALGE